MDDRDFEIISVTEARRALTEGDIRSEVAFQHDVNRLLATLEDLCEMHGAPPAAVPNRF